MACARWLRDTVIDATAEQREVACIQRRDDAPHLRRLVQRDVERNLHREHRARAPRSAGCSAGLASTMKSAAGTGMEMTSIGSSDRTSTIPPR